MIVRTDHVAGAAAIILGLLVFALSGDLPFGSLSFPGAGMWPKLICVLMIVLGILLLARAGASGPVAEIDWSNLRHAAIVTAATAAAIALYPTLGFIVSIGLLLAGLALLERGRPVFAGDLRDQHQRRGLRAVHGLAEVSARTRANRILAWKEGTFDSLLLGFSVAFRPDVLWYAFVGCLVGTLVGVLPGIGPLAGISILLPATFGLDATKAVIMLAGIYYGSQYGGSTTSILMRIPGEASSVMTCIDGYAMAQKGRAGAALCIAAVGSLIAGTFGVLVLTLIAPPLAAFALRFGPPEYTALLVLGLIFLAYMSSTALPRTLLMAAVGLLLGTIGIDNMTGHFRYAFDIPELGDGIGIVPVAVGLFGLGEILSTPSATVIGKVIAPKLRELLPNRTEWRQSAMPIARGSVLGFLVGLTPGSAHIISSFLSYAVERRLSKHPEEFGHGAVAGVAGPESANNAASTGAFVPMLALGLPTGPVTAVLDGGAVDPRRSARPGAGQRSSATYSGGLSRRCTSAI